MNTANVAVSSLRYVNINNSAYFMVRFQLIDKINYYERNIYNLLAFIGDVGGVS